jgi:hypothetical protein
MKPSNEVEPLHTKHKTQNTKHKTQNTKSKLFYGFLFCNLSVTLQ